MKYLSVGIVFFVCNYAVICGQDLLLPKNEKTSHVNISDGNSTVITKRIPASIPVDCPKNMELVSVDDLNNSSICDCMPRFLYFPSNDSCHEAYRQGPCMPGCYVVLPENEVVPCCVANPCFYDGIVPYNGTCYPLKTAGPCAPDGALGVNETTFQIECVPNEVVPFTIINVDRRTCPAGSRRNTLGICKSLPTKE